MNIDIKSIASLLEDKFTTHVSKLVEEILTQDPNVEVEYDGRGGVLSLGRCGVMVDIEGRLDNVTIMVEKTAVEKTIFDCSKISRFIAKLEQDQLAYNVATENGWFKVKFETNFARVTANDPREIVLYALNLKPEVEKSGRK